jgi:hypothetical protein
MRAIRVAAERDESFRLTPLPLPMRQRKGEEDVAHYRRQAKGEEPIGDFGPQVSHALRTILLSDGRFMGLATQAGSLLTFVIAGELSLPAGETGAVTLGAGDVFLTDENSSSKIVLEARHEVRLLQIDVAPDWPGPNAEVQGPGTLNPRKNGGAPNFKRMYTGKDGKAYFADFSEIFPDVADQWTPPRPIEGFRMSCWSNGTLDYHPGVVNQIGLVMSGTLELEVSGDGSKEIFYAGDMCLAQDRTGVGHRNTKRGLSHTTYIVIAEQDLWPFAAELATVVPQSGI